jgi:hypothetical protein
MKVKGFYLFGMPYYSSKLYGSRETDNLRFDLVFLEFSKSVPPSSKKTRATEKGSLEK